MGMPQNRPGYHWVRGFTNKRGVTVRGHWAKNRASRGTGGRRVMRFGSPRRSMFIAQIAGSGFGAGRRRRQAAAYWGDLAQIQRNLVKARRAEYRKGRPKKARSADQKARANYTAQLRRRRKRVASGGSFGRYAPGF